MTTATDAQEAGYFVCERVFREREVARLRAVTDVVLEKLAAGAPSRTVASRTWEDGHRLDEIDGVTVHWEPGHEGDIIRSVNPLTELSPVLEALWTDERLTGPVKELMGFAHDVGPFGSALNLKRAGAGSAFLWHQDYPYWYCCVGDDAKDVATVLLFLDDATADNGPVELIPGSHRHGPARRDRNEGTGMMADPGVVDASRAVRVVVPAGSILCFPGLAIHRSGPNTSAHDRRTILLRFQPAGRVQLQETAADLSRLSELP